LASILAAVLAGIWGVTGVPAAGQAPNKLTISVVRQDGAEQQIAEATVQEYRSSNYVGGTGNFAITTLGITAAITPPAGIKLTPRRVNLSTVQKIEWVPSAQKSGSDHSPVTITYSDGKAETALLWRTNDQPMFNTLGLSTLSVKGMLTIEGQRVEATVEGPFKSMSFASPR
jgi:hypothetical protein